jgi:hypothetical protein
MPKYMHGNWRRACKHLKRECRKGKLNAATLKADNKACFADNKALRKANKALRKQARLLASEIQVKSLLVEVAEAEAAKLRHENRALAEEAAKAREIASRQTAKLDSAKAELFQHDMRAAGPIDLT